MEWKKGHKALRPTDKYKMRQEGAVAELIIQDLELTDAGNYICVCGDKQTMASVTVHGKKININDVVPFPGQTESFPAV